MHPTPQQPPRTLPLGTLGTGTVEIGGDGYFRNIAINNNRTAETRIPLSPHSFLAVRIAGAGEPWIRRLQCPLSGARADRFLSPGGLIFRSQYPLADCRVREEGAPAEIVWSAFSPVIPYDYDASALPLFYIAVQVTNPTTRDLEVSALFNWENLCGRSALRIPRDRPPIRRETLATQADLDRIKGGGPADHERRLTAKSGHIEANTATNFHYLDMPPNALVFGTGDVDASEDGQYCLATPWAPPAHTSLRVWDPDDPVDAEVFWREFANHGGFDTGARGEGGAPGAGAACSRFRLAPGESRSVEFVLSWYCPRNTAGGEDEGNFYANNFPDARAVARTGLTNSRYYFAAINGWHQRLAASEMPPAMVRRLLQGCEVLGAHGLHTRNGAFGLFDGNDDPRVNHLRDRWFWSMGLLLFFPRLELETLDRLTQSMFDETGRHVRISEGLAGFRGGEFAPPGAAQVEAAAQIAILTWRNFVFGGSLSFLNRAAPRVMALLAAIAAQDRDLDGFPDIQQETPGLDRAYASGLNVITAGLWLLALACGERIARRLKLPELAVFRAALERAVKNYQRYFWNNEAACHTLYPDPRLEKCGDSPWQTACHVGQLQAPWMAALLGLDGLFNSEQVRKALETVERHNLEGERVRTLTFPLGQGAPREDWTDDSRVRTCNLIRFWCARLTLVPDAAPPDLARLARVEEGAGDGDRHLMGLAWWYIVLAAPPARLDLAEKRITFRPDWRRVGHRQTGTLYTPNGFGGVTIQPGAPPEPFCQITFRMDIPQEIASIEVVMPEPVADIPVRLEVDEGPIACQRRLRAVRGESRLELIPESRLSASQFQLVLGSPDWAQGAQPSKTPWIPRWLRR